MLIEVFIIIKQKQNLYQKLIKIINYRIQQAEFILLIKIFSKAQFSFCNKIKLFCYQLKIQKKNIIFIQEKNQQSQNTQNLLYNQQLIVQNIIKKMNLKSPKVKKLIDQNGIEIDNFTMVIRLKKIIEQLNNKIQQQNDTIMSLKRDTKTTKINQMEVQIQHLNDQNKRLTLLIEQMKNKYKKQINNYTKIMSMNSSGINNLFKNLSSSQLKNQSTSQCQQFIRSIQNNKNKKVKKCSQNKKDSNNILFTGSIFNFSSNLAMGLHKKSYPQTQKQKQQQFKHQQKQKKFQKKYYQLLEETQKIKKQLIHLRINQSNSIGKKNKLISPEQRNSILLQKNMLSFQKINQKKHDLQAENQILKRKLNQNQKKLNQYQTQNIAIKKSLQDLKTQIKCKNLMTSQRALTVSKSMLFKELSNNIQQNGRNSDQKPGYFQRTQNVSLAV